MITSRRSNKEQVAEWRSLSIREGQEYPRDDILRKLVSIQYERNDINFDRGKFRVRGDVIEIFPAGYSDRAIRIELFGDEVDRILEVDTLTGEVYGQRKHILIYPARLHTRRASTAIKNP